MSIDHVRHTLEDPKSIWRRCLRMKKRSRLWRKLAIFSLPHLKTAAECSVAAMADHYAMRCISPRNFRARFRLDRAGLPATSISDPGHLSCVGNDFGYEFVFSRYLEAHAKKGDCLLAISTSGKSKNVIKAAEVAKKLGVRVIGLMGKPDTPLGPLVDICISTPGGAFADRVQEMHIKVIHIMIELVERALFPENYKESAA